MTPTLTYDPKANPYNPISTIPFFIYILHSLTDPENQRSRGDRGPCSQTSDASFLGAVLHEKCTYK